MPGLVSLKTPPNAPPLQILVSQADKAGTSVTIKAPATPLTSDSSVENPDLAPFLLKLARDTVASGGNPNKALDYAIRASKSFGRCSASGLELAMSLHVVAAIYCSLRRFEEAVMELRRSIVLLEARNVSDHALAKFSGYMQLGDTYSAMGQLERSTECYEWGLSIQIEALGDSDPRVAQTCRYLAEAYIQAMQFDEAETLCKKALEIHRKEAAPASVEEAADRRLMALVCEAKGNYESALEHLVLASMAMIADGQENEVAAIDVSIGNVYLILCRYDEAIFAYQKAFTVFKSTKGADHHSVASVLIRLADLYCKTGKLRESKSYCENALRIYGKPAPRASLEEIASGLTEISAIYEALNEADEALRHLQRAARLLEDKPGNRSTVAGIEAQMGVMFYTVGRYREARESFQSAANKLRCIGENESTFYGIVLNQMGLASLQLYRMDEAVQLFEEAKDILEHECGFYHLDTLGVYSNIAATYDAMGRVEEAIAILEYILKVREEKLGTANPEVDDERKRLDQLLKEAGKVRNRQGNSLQNLLGTNLQGVKRW